MIRLHLVRALAYLATDLAKDQSAESIETIESIKIPHSTTLGLQLGPVHSSLSGLDCSLPPLPLPPAPTLSTARARASARASAIILSFIRRVFKAPAVPGADFTNEASDLYDRSANRGVRGRRAPQVTEFIVKWHPAATHDPYRLH